MKVLLEELGVYKTQKQSGVSPAPEEFPNLLLSSLDKLFEDKQQQLWLVTIINVLLVDKLIHDQNNECSGRNISHE